MSEIVQLESEVPFGKAIYAQLYLYDLQLNHVARRDQMQEHYLAWETVRKAINPYFQVGTGFEGYLVGRAATPEEALDAILDIHQNTLDAIARLYRYEYRFRSRLMKTLQREVSDLDCIHTWSGYLGAELGRLRVQVAQNDVARAFQTQTYQLIKTLPPMVFRQERDDVTQTYAVRTQAGSNGNQRLMITLPMLKPSQQDAWLVAENIGEFGHPLVRKLLDGAPPLHTFHND